jgi:hypothetical protein
MNNKGIDGVYLDGANADDEFFALFPTDAELRRYQDGQRKALASAVSTWRAKRPTKWLTGYASSRERGSSTLGFAADFYCPLASCVGPTQLHPAAAAAATVVTTTSGTCNASLREGWSAGSKVLAEISNSDLNQCCAACMHNPRASYLWSMERIASSRLMR